MYNLFLQGAVHGSTQNEVYFVRCDDESTTQNDIKRGIVNIVISFAPIKPSEFILIKIQLVSGQQCP